MDAGIINDTAVKIDADSLTALNEKGGEANIATGYHAIEFLLWGQDQNADGPGERPYTDYVTGADATAENQDRRGQYLTVVSELLVGHLGELNDAWKSGSKNYRTDFEAAEAGKSIASILTGMIILSGFETGGERFTDRF